MFCVAHAWHIAPDELEGKPAQLIQDMIEFLNIRAMLKPATKSEPGVSWYDVQALHLRDVARETYLPEPDPPYPFLPEPPDG